MSRATKLMKLRRVARRGWRRRRERARRLACGIDWGFGVGTLFVIPAGGEPVRIGTITDLSYAYDEASSG